MRLVIHAGLKKTGSTAIQVHLARNAALLAARGWHIPLLPPGAAQTARTPGNAYALYLHILEGRTREAGDMLKTCLATAARTGCDSVLLSSESLCDLTAPQWMALAGLIAATGCPCTFVVAERDPYTWFFSTWLQAVKREGCPLWLDAALARNAAGFLRPLLTRSILERLPEDRFRTLPLDYDAHRDDMATAFSRALGLPETAEGPQRCNRSLTTRELFVFLSINQASGGNVKLCQRLCDAYLLDDADREPFFFFSPAVATLIAAFLADHGVERPIRAHPDAPDLTEAAFRARFGALEQTLAAVMADAMKFYRDAATTSAGLVLHKARLYAASPARAQVPQDFDILCYLIANPDVLYADCDPYRHFLDAGRSEGRTYRP